jgi:ankyrin repeat protein
VFIGAHSIRLLAVYNFPIMKNILIVAAPVVLAIVTTVVGCKSDVNALNEEGATPLMVAAESGDTEAVHKLIARKADVNRKHRDSGKTALMLAAAKGHAEVVDALLAAGAAVDIRDNDNRTAYSYAFQNNKFDVAHKVQYIAENKVELPTTTTTSRKPGVIVKPAPHTGKQIPKSKPISALQ